MKKITILFTIGNFGTGGKEKQLGETIKVLPKEKYRVFLIYSGGSSHFLKSTYPYLEGSKSINSYDVCSFVAYCNSVKPDILCCWSRPTAYYSLLYRTLIGRKTKIVNSSIQSAPVKKTFLNTVDSLIYNLYDYVTGNSVAGLKAFDQYEKPGRFVLYNGIEVPHYTPEQKPLLKEKLSFSRDGFNVPMVAGLKGTKDHTTLLKAAKIVQDIDSSIKFYIVGDGSNRKSIEERICEDKVENVTLLGNRTDAVDILATSSVSVLCSTNGEGLSNSIMESLALGVPVIATAGGGTGEMLEDGKNGYLINIGDYRALADKIIFLKNNPGVLAQMSIEASKVRDKFSVTKMIENFDSIIDQVYVADKPLSKDK